MKPAHKSTARAFRIRIEAATKAVKTAPPPLRSEIMAIISAEVLASLPLLVDEAAEAIEECCGSNEYSEELRMLSKTLKTLIVAATTATRHPQ